MRRQKPVTQPIDYGNGLHRLPDPVPDQWLYDTSQVMQTSPADPNGFVKYGNFWGRRPCHWWPHNWYLLRYLGDDQNARAIRRCRRCGSQICTWAMITPPVRDVL